MLRQSPSRNQRSKSVKVKHVLQIALLLAVCFWLIFQVKHSHDKKREFDESNAKISRTKPSSDVILKLGRKAIIKDEKPDGEEAEEEEETGGEEDAHGEEELEGDGKIEEKVDGDDEIGDHDQENSDMDVDHQEDFVDDEKEREEGNETESEKDDEGKEGQTEDGIGNSSEDRKYDGGARITHEAREEPYKADDASSAVTQGSSGNPNENDGKNITEYDNKVNVTVLNWEMAENGTTSNATTTEEKLREIVSPKSEVASPSNSTVTIESKVDLEVSNNLTGAGKFVPDSNRFYSNSTLDTKTENTAATERETTDSTLISETQRMEGNTTTESTGEGNNSLRLFKDENAAELEHDPIDSSDSFNVLEEEVHMDPETLPQVQTEVSTTETQ